MLLSTNMALFLRRLLPPLGEPLVNVVRASIELSASSQGRTDRTGECKPFLLQLGDLGYTLLCEGSLDHSPALPHYINC